MAVVSVITVAYGGEPWLEQCVASVLASGVDDLEIVLVDNGTDVDLRSLASQDQRIRIVGHGENLGFAGGVNLGVARSSGETVVLLNSDALLTDGALPTLVAAATEPGAGIVGALIVLAEDPGLVNSAGNPLHILGLSWAGGYGRATTTIAPRTSVASASGAGLALRRSLWDRLGGFHEAYFAYYEDMDLSWRCHLQGLPVTVLADAKVAHHYEFSRNALKMYLLERNRLLFLLTTFQRRTLAVIAPPLLGMEVALLAAAASQGWGREKLRGWAWLIREHRQVRALRRRVQAERLVDDAALLGLLTDTFDTDQLTIPAWTAPLQSLLRLYWQLFRGLLGAGGAASSGRIAID
ncbi:MAG TPA: glycosyltransferase family 2 protein [Actinomycetota bacterium]|nr:glycosyltransferase family 2 protein [Actinomycetota bacterium]